LDHAPTTRESNEAGLNARQLSLRVGGKWVDVLKAARIDISSRPKRATLLSTPTEILIDDVLAVARRLGRTPKASEYAAKGHSSFLALRRRLGGWRRWRQVRKLVAVKLSVSPHDMTCVPRALISQSVLLTEAAVEAFFDTTAGQASPPNASQ
jgi:hypothetical protein